MTPNDHCFLIGMPLCYPVPLSGGWIFLLPSMTKIWQMWLDDTSNIRLWKEDKFCLVISLGLLPKRRKFPCCEAVLGRGPFEKSPWSADSHQRGPRYRFSSQLNLWMRPKSQLTWWINCNLMRNSESEASSANLTGFSIYRNNDLIHAQNSPNYASTVHEPRTSRCLGQI